MTLTLWAAVFAAIFSSTLITLVRKRRRRGR
jgi:hypothetical protein